MKKKLGKTELENIVNGAAFLASGGGGSLELGHKLVQWILEVTEAVELIDIGDVGAEDWGAVVAAIGAPDAIRKIGIYHSPTRAFELLEQIRAKKFSYTLSVEIGTASLFSAMLTAALKEISIVDCDGAGRAVPELEMTTYASNRIPVSPSTVASEKYEEVKAAFYAKTPSDMEQLLRPTISTKEFGQIAGFATYAMSGQTLKEKKPVLVGTISRTQQLGATMRQAREQGKDPIKAVLDFFNNSSDCDEPQAFLLFQGKVKKVKEQTEGGFDQSIVTLEDNEKEVYVIIQNENLIVWQSNKPKPIAMHLLHGQ